MPAADVGEEAARGETGRCGWEGLPGCQAEAGLRPTHKVSEGSELVLVRQGLQLAGRVEWPQGAGAGGLSCGAVAATKRELAGAE